jgi:hypothetical protein
MEWAGNSTVELDGQYATEHSQRLRRHLKFSCRASPNSVNSTEKAWFFKQLNFDVSRLHIFVMSQNRKIIFQFQSVHWREDSITYEIG